MILAQQIATYLYYLELGIFEPENSNGNIYIDRLPEGEQKIAIYNRGGVQSDSKLGYQTPGIQIVYRGNRNPIDSFQIAESLFFALNGFNGDTFIDGGNYIVSCLSQQAGPEILGANENGYFEYSMNFLVEYQL